MKIHTNNLSYVASNFKKIPRKLKREIYKIPPVQLIQDQVYQKALNSYAPFLPKIDQQGKSILEKLQTEGTCIIPLADLCLPSSEKMMKTALSLANNLKNQTVEIDSSCEIGLSAKYKREFPEILLWALEPKLLDIVENYIGLPVMYQFYSMRRSIANGICSGVRKWHMDWEDRRVIKIIIYLNDVLEGGGPYEYIPRQITSEAKTKLKYNNLGYVSDEKMQKVISQSDWKFCFASQGSVVISDTGSVFHRAQPPTKNDRFSITFCYTTRKPQIICDTRKISSQHWEIINSSINVRQKSCLSKKLLDQFE